MVTPENDEPGSAPSRPLPAPRPVWSARRCRETMLWRALGIVLLTPVREPPTPAAPGRRAPGEDDGER